jgi:hypothetical protein
VSVFCYQQSDETLVLFAMGEHLNTTVYQITLLWQPAGPFAKNKKINL